MIDYSTVEPGAAQALLDLTKYVRGTSLDKGLRNLINIRASQINGCAFCLDMHTQEARAHGESQQRLDTLSAWRDTPFFTPKERAALELTEYVTEISVEGVPEDVMEEAEKQFSHAEIVQVVMAVIAINCWNRMSIATGQQPAPRREHSMQTGG